jgi:hypothetical protein
LIRHLIDTKGRADIGFMLFAMRVDPPKLIGIIEYEANRQTLIQTCIHLNFNKEAAQLIADEPTKFLWQDLLEFFKGKDSGLVKDMIMILAKVQILSDPGAFLPALYDIYA